MYVAGMGLGGRESLVSDAGYVGTARGRHHWLAGLVVG